MEKDLVRLAQEYVAGNRDALIRQAISNCVFPEDNFLDEELCIRYEHLLRAMVHQDASREAAAAYMFIALTCSMLEFSLGTGIQMLLQTNAFGTYNALLEEYREAIGNPARYAHCLSEPLLIAAEIAYDLELDEY